MILNVDLRGGGEDRRGLADLADVDRAGLERLGQRRAALEQRPGGAGAAAARLDQAQPAEALVADAQWGVRRVGGFACAATGQGGGNEHCGKNACCESAHGSTLNP